MADNQNYDPSCQHVSDGNGIQNLRTPVKFLPFNGLSIATETTIWTPATGKKFRFMGFCLSSGGTQGNILLRDNTGGGIILIIPKMPADTPLVPMGMGNGIVSQTANNVLTATGTATQTLSGFIFGTEE